MSDSEENGDATTKISKVDIAGLLKTLTATVEKIADAASSKPPPLKRCKPAEDESDGEQEAEVAPKG